MQPLTALESLSDTSGIGQIKQAIVEVTKKYLINESEFLTVINCESSFRTTAIGDSGLAYGILQFHKPTFDAFCSGDYYSAKDQLECAAKMWSENPANKLHWTCWSKYFTN